LLDNEETKRDQKTAETKMKQQEMFNSCNFSLKQWKILQKKYCLDAYAVVHVPTENM
jgi:hypothetical protein